MAYYNTRKAEDELQTTVQDLCTGFNPVLGRSKYGDFLTTFYPLFFMLMYF